MKSRVYLIGLLCCFLLPLSKSYSQDLGISFPFFFPEKAGLSVPVAPFAIDGVGITFNKVVGLSTGFSWYRMSGMGVRDFPFESEASLFQPFSSFFLPLNLSIIIPIDHGKQKLSIVGGYFFAYNANMKVDQGALDRSLSATWNWPVVNSVATANGGLASGFTVGLDHVVYLKKNFGISIGGRYLLGSADLDIQGTAVGLDENQALATREFDFKGGLLNYRGLDISVGVVLKNKK